MPPYDAPTIARLDQVLGRAAKMVDIILLDELNVRLREPRDAQEEEIVMVVADCILEEMTDHFMPRQKYIRDRRFTWQIHR